jgi:hypothetical protein
MNIVLGNWKILSESELRLKPQYTQNKGFFCSLTWLLQCLPYIDNDIIHKQNVGFSFYSHNYGSYPNFSVFGKHLITKFPSLPSPEQSIDIKEIFKINYKSLDNNFKYANDLFFKYFDFSNDIYIESKSISDLFINKKTLGLHFRGTDKLNVKWADHTSADDFLSIVDDYLSNNSIDCIFFCTDCLYFKNKIIDKYSNIYTLHYNKNNNLTNNALHLSRLSAIEGTIKGIKYKYMTEEKLEKECTINEEELKTVIMDSMILSKCSTVIKTHSLVSCFSKIINPDLEIYRINGCSEVYYPESYIPFYTTNNVNIQNILNKSKKLPY